MGLIITPDSLAALAGAASLKILVSDGTNWVASAYSISGVSGKTLTFNKSLTLEGTDATTMTFPGTSATIARTDAANTFTGHQTIEGVTSTGATGTGKFVFDDSPTLSGHPSVEGVTSTGATGSGNFVFATSPSLVTPILGTPASGTATNLTGTADGLTAGGVTRNHAVYAAASPPTVDVGLFTITLTGIDMKTAATTSVFTVPTSRTFICVGAYFIVTSVTGGGAGTQTFKIQDSGTTNPMTANAASGSGTPSAGIVYAQVCPGGSGPFRSCTAGNIVQVVVATSHAGSTAVSGTLFVQGFYSS